MQINYIFGNNKTSKTSTIVEMAKEFQLKGEKTVIIVPEQTTLSTEKKLIDSLESILNVQVYSFLRLSNKVFQESGLRNFVNLEETGKLMLLKRILLKNEKEFKYYKKSAIKQGFVTELSDMISDLYKNNITLTEITDLINKEEISEVVKLKLTDIKLILEEYDEFLSNEFISMDDTLDILASRIEESTYLKDINVIIDGFFSLTEQEYRVLENLVKNIKSLTVTFNVNISKGTNYFEGLNKFDPYFEPKKMVNNITEILEENNFRDIKTTVVTEKTEQKGDLLHLKQNYLRFRNAESFSSKTENIEIILSKNKIEECKTVALKISEFIDNGFTYNDIKIICGDIGDYKTILQGVFEQYDIPYFIDEKDSIFMNSLTQVVTGMFSVVYSNYYFENVMNLLKIDLFSSDLFTDDEIDLFENYLIEYGIKGYMFEKPFVYGKKNKKYVIDDINQTREKFVNKLKSFSDELSITKRYNVKMLATKVINFIEENNIAEKLDNIIQTAQERQDLRRKREYEQIWDKFVELLEKIVDILGNEEVSVKEFADILASGLEAESIGLIPLSQNEIVVGDYQRSKFSKCEIVFIMGARDDAFPVRPKENSVISDSEKDILKKHNEKIVTSSELFLKQNLLIYDIVTLANEKLIISYPFYTLKGEVNTEAQIVKKIMSIFKDVEPTSKDYIYPLNKNAMFSFVAKLIKKEQSGVGLTENELEFIEFYKNDSAYKEKVEVIEKVTKGYKPEQLLSIEAVNNLYNHKMVSSVSKLERYAKCPFAYFLDYNLKIREREFFEVEYADIGTVFHFILDRFVVYIEKNKIDYKDITEELISKIVDEIIDGLEDDEFIFIFKHSHRYSYYLDRMKEIAKSSINALVYHKNSGKFDIAASEFTFGENNVSKIVINIDDKNEVILTGKVDRIDIYEDGNQKYVKILDFKTGSKSFKEKEVRLGVQLQLLTYLDIILKKGTEIFGNMDTTYIAGGVYYFEIKSATLSEDKYKNEIIKNNLSSEDIKKLLLKEFMLDGVTNHDLDLIKNIDSKLGTTENDTVISKSDIIKADITSKGELSKKSSTITSEKFDELRTVVNENIYRLSCEIFSGRIDIDYNKSSELSACEYCDFSSICKKDK